MTLNVNALTGNTLGRIGSGVKKPLLTKLPGIHVSEGPLCKEATRPVRQVSDFYQHFLTLPTQTQLLLNKLLNCFKKKQLIDQESTADIQEFILSAYKSKSLKESTELREFIVTQFKTIFKNRSRRSHPRHIKKILLDFFTLKSQKKHVVKYHPTPIIDNQLELLENILLGSQS